MSERRRLIGNLKQNKSLMKYTKTLMLTGLVAGSFLTINLSAPAQDSTNAAPGASAAQGKFKPRGFNIDKLGEQLNLTDDQKPKVKAVLDGMMQKMRDVRSDMSIQPADKRSKFMEIRNDANTKLQAILTPDQYTKWQQLAPMNRHRPAPQVSTPAPTPPPQQ